MRTDKDIKKALRELTNIFEFEPIGYWTGWFFPRIAVYGSVEFYIYPNEQGHNKPHLHVKYQQDTIVLEIPTGKVLEGKLKGRTQKLASRWVVDNSEMLIAKWNQVSNGITIYAKPR